MLKGVYVGTGSGELANYESWLGGKPDVELSYLNNDSWTAFDSSISWAAGIAKATGVPSIWSVPLTVNGTSLEQVATGSLNSHFLTAAQTLSQAQTASDGNIYVRVGWEFNGSWMPWAAQGHEQAFITAYQQLVDTFRSVSSKFKFVWDVNEGGSNIDPSTAYPGDKFVDVVGMDTYYNTAWDPSNPVTAFTNKVSEQYGLQWQQQFATAHGKATSLSEWGVQSDNAGSYIQAMTKWMNDHNMVFEDYWDSNASFDGKLSDDQYPGDVAAYKAAFGIAQSSSISQITTSSITDAALSPATIAVSSSNQSQITASASSAQSVQPMNSASSSQMFGTITFDTTGSAGKIYALYEMLLGHAPDPLGLEAFNGAMQNGATPTDVAAAILGSPEYGAKNPAPLSEGAFVSGLYISLFNRTPDPQGAAFFQSELSAGIDRATVVSQIASSLEAQNVLKPTFASGVFVPEATDAQIARLYFGILGRSPDTNGLSSFETQVKDAGLASVAQTMLSSAEFDVKFGNLSDAVYVDTLYLNALGHHANAQAISYWDNQLSSIGRVEVAVQIAQSQEAQIHLVGQIEQYSHAI